MLQQPLLKVVLETAAVSQAVEGWLVAERAAGLAVEGNGGGGGSGRGCPIQGR